MTVPVVNSADLAAVPAAVDDVLRDFLASKTGTGNPPELRRFAGLLREFLDGGKRLRPLLCCCGWQAAGGGDPAPVLPAAASLELFHTFALIHDDVMDRSDTRRGRPTVHRVLAARARRLPQLPDPERFGNNAAILLGDLAMVWSDELLHTGGALPAGRLAAARTVLDGMRSEIMYGQYLDLLGSADFDGGPEAALTVVRYKTARYTTERPLQLGAALAGGDRTVLEACTAYGVPLGEAFQLRDDVLGVFGDPAVTGKPCLDDLREGKHTVLLAVALRQADPFQARALRTLVGDPGLDERGAATVRDILRRTGALDAVEDMIAERRRQAVRALEESPFPPAVRATLNRFVTVATDRAA